MFTCFSLPHLDYCHGASTDNGKKRCLKGTQLSSTTFNNSMVNRGHRVPWETGLLSKESLCGSQNLGLTSCSSQCHKSRRNSLRSLPAFPCLYWALTRHGFHSVRDQWWPFEWNLSLELRKENKSYRLETTEDVGRDPSIRQWVSLPLQFSRSSSRGPLLPCWSQVQCKFSSSFPISDSWKEKKKAFWELLFSRERYGQSYLGDYQLRNED